MSKTAEGEAEKTNLVLDEVSRCISHMQIGKLSATRNEPLHARVLQCIPRYVTDRTKTVAFALRDDGLGLYINPDYFMDELQSTDMRLSALRHEEQHLFLNHPFREWAYARQMRAGAIEGHSQLDVTLFRILADIEANQFISGYSALPDAITAALFTDFKVPKAAAVESLYLKFYPLWTAVQEAVELNPQNPDFSHLDHPQSAAALFQLSQSTRHSDHQFWSGDKTELHPFQHDLLKSEVDRLLVRAREMLTIKERTTIDSKVTARIDRILTARHLVATDPQIADAAEQEINAILVQMLIYDPFFGKFITGCIRQITDTIPTAGVMLYRKNVALLVNPKFFMNELKNRAERAGVLKHEALHIMLKHIIMMRRDEINNKRLYNIAADLEVNQYIGSPWALPEGAILLSTFPDIDLPPNDTAETYYNLLLKAQKEKKKSLQKFASGQHAGQGHSDHRGWGGPEQEDEDQATAKDWQNNPVNGARPEDLDAHEIDIERQVKQAADALSSKQAGSIPGTFQSLLNQWQKKRQPKIDWKRQLRLFVSSNPGSTLKRSSRKKSKRYVYLLRQSLKSTVMPADVINALSHIQPESLPVLKWSQLPEDVSETIRFLRPQKSVLIGQDKAVIWHDLPLKAILEIQGSFPELSWPTWDDVPDEILHRLDLIRTPLDPKQIPIEIFISLAKAYPKLLPAISWDDFDVSHRRRIQKALPFIQDISWSLLPAEEILTLYKSKPELFKLGWNQVPPQFIAQNPYYRLVGKEPFRMDRILKRSIPGLKIEKHPPKVLLIIDTSGSVGDVDLEYFFAEIHAIHKLGAEVHILQADTSPQLYFKYTGETPVAGRGGTCFDPALAWLNDARFGVQINTKTPFSGHASVQDITLRVDGVIYLTDGYASTPSIKPYCKMMWVLTPSGSDEAIRQFPHHGVILKLPPYEER